jgi:hypothetical protein
MQFRNILCSAAATVAMVATPVLAQQTANIDALASLEAPEATLSITPQSDLRFGRVTIPNTSRGASTVCQYSLGFSDAARAFRGGTSELPSNESVPLGGSTLAGCQMKPSGQTLGELQIRCVTSSEVDVTAIYNSTSTGGVNFFNGPASIPMRFFSLGETTPLINIFAPQILLNGLRASAVPCPDSGVIDMVIGGSMSVDTTAVPTPDAVIGTISVAVNY